MFTSASANATFSLERMALHCQLMPTAHSYAAMYAVVRRIPCGRVATYGQIARLAGTPGAARLAGYALSRCPAGLPWHRVINARGHIALPAGSTGALRQRRRLEGEGIVFIGERIDLARFGWQV